MRLRRTELNKPGFSLIELMLFMALSASFLILSTQLVQWAIDFRLESSGSSAVDLSGQYVYRRLLYDLRRSSNITYPTTAGSSGSSLGLSISGSTHTYTMVNNRLILNTLTGSEDILDSKVRITQFSVTKTGSDPQTSGVQISFLIESLDETSGGLSQSRSWQFAYILR